MEEIKEKIIATVSEMLSGGMSAEDVTVREITSRLGISVSTINYHFGSKDNLMRIVVKKNIDGIIAMVPVVLREMDGLSAREQLRRMVKLTADYLVKFESVSRISILSDLQDGHGRDNTFGTIRAYEPMVRELVSEEAVDIYGMILCFTLQGLFMRMEVLQDEGIVSFSDKEQRDGIIDRIFDVVFPKLSPHTGTRPSFSV